MAPPVGVSPKHRAPFTTGAALLIITWLGIGMYSVTYCLPYLHYLSVLHYLTLVVAHGSQFATADNFFHPRYHDVRHGQGPRPDKT
jgi:hypothetical protein